MYIYREREESLQYTYMQERERRGPARTKQPVCVYTRPAERAAAAVAIRTCTRAAASTARLRENKQSSCVVVVVATSLIWVLLMLAGESFIFVIILVPILCGDRYRREVPIFW